jgi:hypothetical protein
MSEDNSVKHFHLSCLHALQSQRPDKPMGQVRWAWAEINAALNAGHTLKVVHQRLGQDGVVIPYSTLARYVNRIRCEEARQNLRAGAFASYPGRRPLKARTLAAASFDPLASAMEALSKPRYSVRDAMCDGDPTKKKLI